MTEPSQFTDEDLTGARFRRVNLTGSDFHEVTLDRSTWREMSLDGIVGRGMDLIDLDLYGWLGKVVLNGVDVVPFVEAELDRRYPDRAAMRPDDVEGFRRGWDVVERLWIGTIERARALDPALLEVSVGGEWSFLMTLRHLAFATESWVSRAILGDPSPWHPLSLPWAEMPDASGVPRDLAARPTLEEVLALRHDRMAVMRRVVDALTDEQLAGDTTPVEGIGWPLPQAYPVKRCLRTVLNEEWEHRLFAERDLDALVAPG